MKPRSAVLLLLLIVGGIAYHWHGLGIFLAGLALVALIAYALLRPPRRYRRHSWGQMEEFFDNRAGIFGRSYPEDPVGPESSPKVGRNDPCPCGSGKKFKRCCYHMR